MSLSSWAVVRRASLPAALAASAVVSPLLPSAPAFAAGTGNFYVHVYNQQTGREVPAVQVQLIDTATGTVVGILTTDANGWVSFPNLPEGSSYVAHVAGTAAFKEVYSRADTIDASPYGGNVGESLLLTPTTLTIGRIAGTVTASDNTVNARINIYPATATKAAIESGSITAIATQRVGGYYYGGSEGPQPWTLTVPGGATTKYKVQVVDRDAGYTQDCSGYFCTDVPNSAFWIGSPSNPTVADDATQTTVPTGATVSTATLNIPGGSSTSTPRITGTVTGTAGRKLDYVGVNLKAKLPDGTWQSVDYDYTGSDGTFGFNPPASVGEGTNEYQCYEYGVGWQAIPEGDPCASGSTRWHYTYTEVPLDATTKYQLRFVDGASDEYRSQWLGGVDATSSSTPPAEAEVSAFTVPAAPATIVENTTMTAVPLDKSTGVNGKLTDNAGVASRGTIRFYDLSGNYVETVYGRRDGTWTAPITELPPGTYKVRFSTNEGYEWYGGTSFRTALTVATTVTGAGVNLGSSGLNRLGTLAGKVTVPKVTPTSVSDPAHIYPVDSVASWVSIYDANLEHVDDVETNADGTWSDKLAPGTYYIGADGEASSSWDDTDQQVSAQPMIKKYWSTAYFLSQAKAVTVGGGGTVGSLNFTLGNTLVAIARPTIKGTHKVGYLQTATAGSWNDRRGIAYAYQWYRGTTKITGATKSTYKATSKDKGKLIKVRVTARDTDGLYKSGYKDSAAVKIY
jgi:hypothetical protein